MQGAKLRIDSILIREMTSTVEMYCLDRYKGRCAGGEVCLNSIVHPSIHNYLERKNNSREYLR